MFDTVELVLVNYNYTFMRSFIVGVIQDLFLGGMVMLILSATRSNYKIMAKKRNDSRLSMSEDMGKDRLEERISKTDYSNLNEQSLISIKIFFLNLFLKRIFFLVLHII